MKKEKIIIIEDDFIMSGGLEGLKGEKACILRATIKQLEAYQFSSSLRLRELSYCRRSELQKMLENKQVEVLEGEIGKRSAPEAVIFFCLRASRERRCRLYCNNEDIIRNLMIYYRQGKGSLACFYWEKNRLLRWRKEKVFSDQILWPLSEDD